MALRDRLDPETTGGGYLLGLRGLVVIAHGSSSRVAIGNAIRLAARGVEHDVVGAPRRATPPGVGGSADGTPSSGRIAGHVAASIQSCAQPTRPTERLKNSGTVP